ncbi:MAG: DNA gyrase subunit A [Bacteriovoracaceae bacterium]|jgi:DNA gyrase subunit A|nr:DNA gyrase subunit A [Bacteriovoracaceae bacterium]
MDENTTPKDISPVSIQTEMRECYLDYAMSVIIGRALPDVRDGLKPVHRRALFSMHKLGNYHNKAFVKSARVVGDVIGKYHPHGDSAVYNTIVRLAQPFSMRYTLVDGQGNFGSVDGDNPAAMRYTEIRMKKLSEEMLKDIDKETVEWQPNYDDSLVEPVVLPSKIPNLLINGSAGIAVGMATNIPPHNLTEVMTALIGLIDNKEMSIAELMEIIPGPDFPTGGSIHGIEGIRSAYHTGKGIIQIRAKAEIEPFGKTGDRERIIIHEIPYQVNKARFIEKVAELVNTKALTGISDIRDESNKLGIRVVIDLKRGEMGQVILNKLYKNTQLQVSFGIIFLSIYHGQPKVMDLKTQLLAFMDHRREVVIRRTIFDLKKAKERAHLLEGLKIAVENIDAIIEMIKASEGPNQARASLMSGYSLSEKQAQAILDMRLQRLTGLERDKILKDYKDILAEIGRLEGILSSDSEVSNIIKDEFQTILESYGDERKTDIVGKANEIQMKDLIKNEEVIVTITHKGYIKRMSLDTYKSQRRGGTGVKGAAATDDWFTNLFTVYTHSNILIATSRGSVFSLPVYQIPEGTRTAKGRNLVNLVSVAPGETIKAIIPLPDDYTEKYLIFCTKRGVVKRSELSQYKNIKSSGLKGIKVVDGDAIVDVRVSNGKHDILIAASSGKSIRFSEDDCRAMGRVSQGVRGITLTTKEHVIGMEIITDDDQILSVTENGYGKRTEAKEYRQQSRGGKGILAMKLTSKTGDIIQMLPVSDKDDLMIITDKGQVIRTNISGISLMGRTTQGVRLINLKTEEKVVCVEKIVDPAEEPAINEEEL